MSKRDEVIAGIVDNLRRIFQAVNTHSRRAKKESGLTGPQLWAIRMIDGSGPIKVSDLSRKMYLHPATVVGILDRLERVKLVKRVRSLRDRRLVHVNLTKKGRDIVRKSPEVAQGLMVSGLESISMQKLNKISRGMGEMARILRVEERAPKLLLSPEVNIPGEDRGLKGRELKKHLKASIKSR
jgi:MarR family transcriptional regulator, organic hydroperoxide resistance regulator